MREVVLTAELFLDEMTLEKAFMCYACVETTIAAVNFQDQC